MPPISTRPKAARSWAEGIPVYPDYRFKNDTTHAVTTTASGAVIRLLEVNRASVFETSKAGFLLLKKNLRDDYLSKGTDAALVGIVRGRNSVRYAIYVEDGALPDDGCYRPVGKECRCGCGQDALPGRRYINGHSGTHWRKARNEQTHPNPEQSL